MYKKIIFILFLCCFITSCGKKSDPIFKESKKEKHIKSIFVYRA
tara:strand:+ start:304 stop:435 length:132 start_codon:yes stop_codon:yes gene_type:complete